MRRFFSRNSKDKKDDKQHPAGPTGYGKDGVSHLKGTHDIKDAPGIVEASLPATKHDIQVAPPTTPAKQVAFAVKTLPPTPESLPRVQDYEGVHSHASYHGRQSANASRPTAALSCFPSSSPTNLTNRTASNPLYTTQHLSPIIPSLPTRHVSLDVSSAARARDRDATLRASQTPISPTRGEIPRFQIPPTPSSQHQQRSGTSMSHDTSVSTSSSHLEARHAFYGSNNSSNSEKAYYPNLAVLATYSRDMSATNGGHGQHSIMQHLTWSEITDEQLVENLGGRERTRQEVLFEMVCSEERYVQELMALKENYLQPLLERHCYSTTQFPSAHDQLVVSTTRSTSGPIPSLDDPTYPSGTIRSTTSIEARRPFLSLSAGSTSANIRYAPPVSSDHGHGNLYSRASHRASESHPTASSDHLPIAARFARKISVDSPSVPELGDVNHPASSSTDTARTAVEETLENHKHGRRDISGGSGGTGITAIDSSVEDTDISPKHHAQFGVLSSSGKGKPKSRLHPLFANLSSSSRNAEKEHTAFMESSTSLNAAPHKIFKHHLKNLVPPVPNKLHKVSSPDLKGSTLAGPGWMVRELPGDLKVVCEVVMKQILEGHQMLSERLRARYEEQYPLVRTLADVFHNQAWMIEHYATYVLHLERALADIEETLSLVNPLLASNKKIKSKDKELVKEQKILAKIIMHLEEEAALKGAPGLSICLSQPFQRLLKYPLLFQSLLYHTDPSTRDYDATQKLAFEIDAIVRSIESEKASEEDRASTRDVWARIDGINDRALLSPRPDRLLVSEAAMWSSSMTGHSAVAAGRRTFSDASRTIDPAQAEAAAASKKKTMRRLSDMTGIGHHHDGSEKKKKQPSVGSKRDVWLVSFTDVVIRCQVVGVTKLPMQNSLGSEGHVDSTGKENYRRIILLTNKERNLYKFLKIDHWVMADKTSPGRAGVVSMADVARSRRTSERIDEDYGVEDVDDLESAPEIQRVKFERDQEGGLDTNGGESRMSFTYSENEPRPVVFDIDPLVGLNLKTSRSGNSTAAPKSPSKLNNAASTATQQAARKRGVATAKFSNRLRPSIGESSKQSPLAKRAASPALGQHPPRSASATRDREGERGGFNKPTAASLAKASPPTSAILTPGNKLPRPDNGRITPPNTKRLRAASSNASPGSGRPSTSTAMIPPSPQSPPRGVLRERRYSLPSSKGGQGTRTLRTKHSSEKLGQHGRNGSDMNSGVALYNQYWQEGQ